VPWQLQSDTDPWISTPFQGHTFFVWFGDSFCRRVVSCSVVSLMVGWLVVVRVGRVVLVCCLLSVVIRSLLC